MQKRSDGPPHAGAAIIRVAKGLAGIAAACGLWELVRAVGWVNPKDLPSLASIIQRLIEDVTNGRMVTATADTLVIWLEGLAIASVLGALLGVAVGLSRVAETIATPYIDFLRPVPSAALIPVGLVILGLTPSMELSLIVYASIWPVLFMVKAGVEDVEPRFLDVGRIIGLARIRSIVSITIKNALPSLATGIRTASAIALILAITVEMVTGRPGLGQYLSAQRLVGNSAAVWAGVFVTGVLGYAINIAALQAERRLFFWSVEHRVVR